MECSICIVFYSIPKILAFLISLANFFCLPKETLLILDVIILVQIILGQSQDNVAGDINQDGIYNIIDVIQLVNIILNNL